MIYGRRLTLTPEIYFITFDVIYQTQETVFNFFGISKHREESLDSRRITFPLFDIPLDRNENQRVNRKANSSKFMRRVSKRPSQL